MRSAVPILVEMTGHADTADREESPAATTRALVRHVPHLPTVSGPPGAERGGLDAHDRLVATVEGLERLRNEDPREVWARAEATFREAKGIGAEDVAARARLVVGGCKGWLGDLAGQGSEATAALRWATEQGDRLVAARSYRLLAVFYTFLGDSGTALQQAINAVELNDEHTSPHTRALCITWLAIAMADTGSLAAARERFKEAAAIAKELGDTALLCSIVNSMSFAHYRAGDMATAISAADELDELIMSHDLLPLWSYVDTIARAQLGIGRPDLAQRTIERASATLEEFDRSPLVLLTFVLALRTNGKLAEAQAALDECRRTCETSDRGAVGVQLLEEQAALFAASGRFEDAYKTHRQYHAAAEALGSREREARAKVLQTVYELEEAKRATHEYRELATRDPLTRLHNRRFVDRELPLLLAEAASECAPLTIGIADLDHFKRINDTHGHDAGDRVLEAVARLLSDHVPRDGSVARLGGEEFLLIMPRTSLHDALRRCEEARVALASHDWEGLVGDLPVTASIGLATSREADSKEALLRLADLRLYAAKQGGRDCIVTTQASP